MNLFLKSAILIVQFRFLNSGYQFHYSMLEYILSALILTLCVIFTIYFTKAKNEPPGPKGYPFLGVVFEVDIYNTYQKLHEWGQTFGDVFQFQILGRKFVCINSMELLQETFLKEPNATITAHRPSSFIGKYLLDDYADIVSSSPSVTWTKRRKFSHRLLHAYGEGLESIETQILQNILTFKQNVRQISERNINPSSLVEEFILGTIEFLVKIYIHRYFFVVATFSLVVFENDKYESFNFYKMKKKR